MKVETKDLHELRYLLHTHWVLEIGRRIHKPFQSTTQYFVSQTGLVFFCRKNGNNAFDTFSQKYFVGISTMIYVSIVWEKIANRSGRIWVKGKVYHSQKVITLYKLQSFLRFSSTSSGIRDTHYIFVNPEVSDYYY